MNRRQRAQHSNGKAQTIFASTQVIYSQRAISVANIYVMILPFSLVVLCPGFMVASTIPSMHSLWMPFAYAYEYYPRIGLLFIFLLDKERVFRLRIQREEKLWPAKNTEGFCRKCPIFLERQTKQPKLFGSLMSQRVDFFLEFLGVRLMVSKVLYREP